ncbi:MAG: polyribonucleotide nucleotidyltransferase [Opitutae bacterium]|nr:polyribonucleotide nucleotidyltransferase [Opitutae bacterium]
MKQKHSVTSEKTNITFNSGDLAGLASGSVTMELGETNVFVSVTAASKLRPDQNWFPLTVDYREKFAAGGRFPGGFFKREGRPNEKEILTCRLCDRPLRPLFPKGFMNEVQVIGYLLSTDLVNEPDILMVNGASAALMISDIPWNGPVGCVRLGEIDGEFVVNPNNEQIFDSALDLIYVGSETEMLMIEGSADQMPEERFIEALEFAHDAIQDIIAAQRKLAELCGKEKKDFDLVQAPDNVMEICRGIIGDRLNEAIFAPSKQEREVAVSGIKDEASAAVEEQLGEEFDPNHVNMAFEVLQEEIYRENILERNKRADGRGPDDLREITCQTGALPRVHGSAVFQRGETQTLVMTTLGTGRDTQDLDGLTGGPASKSFLLHYNFPPFSVGEAGRFGFTSRREIGHGALAERSLLPVLPSEDDFPYAIRLVSEIMSSNGSTSMASICGGSLALMDAGVPTLGSVAGISAGLVSKPGAEGGIEKHVVLTDIIGAEDHFGDMDFKIAGTRQGVTGFQLDLKINGLPFDIAKEAIARITEARHKILDVMDGVQNGPRQELREHAPRIETVMIDPDKIGALIGPGGKNIRRITEITGADINIDDDNSGKVHVYATTGEAMERALEEVNLSTGDIEVGKTYRGVVRGVKDFGAFVECLPGKEGLVHISELADFRVNKTEDICKLGDEIIVKCIGIDERGKVRLSRKAVLQEAEGGEGSSEASGQEAEVSTVEIEVGETYTGSVTGVKDFGAFVECLPGKEGLVHISELADYRVNKTADICKIGDEMTVKCIGIDDRGKVRLSRKAALEDAENQDGEDSPEEAVEENEEETEVAGQEPLQDTEVIEEATEAAEDPSEEGSNEEAAEESSEEEPNEEASEESSEGPVEEAPAEDSEEEKPSEDTPAS